jgi:hypothetical protein
MRDWSMSYELIDKDKNPTQSFQRTARFKNAKWARNDLIDRHVLYFGINRTVPAGEACQIGVQPGGVKTPLDAAKSGYCVGLVKALLFVGRRLQEPDNFCAPEGVTIGQGTRVVLKYLNDNPDKTHSPAENLAVAAFRAAWRCK